MVRRRESRAASLRLPSPECAPSDPTPHRDWTVCGPNMTVSSQAHEAPSLEHFLNQGRRKLAEKYLDTKLVAFRFEGEVDPDPSQAPLTAHHPMRDVVAALEEELFAFRPEFIFPFLRDALARFPARLSREDAFTGPLLDEDYGRRVQESITMLVERVVMERPEEPFEWLDEWLVGRGGAPRRTQNTLTTRWNID